MNRLNRAAMLAATVAAVSSSAQAQTANYNLSDASNPGACSLTTAGAPTTGLGNVWSCASQTSNTASLRVSAYSTSSTSSSSAFAKATVINHGSTYGLGVGNADEGGYGADAPNHSMDNGGRFDLFVLEFFNAPVRLNSVTLGWTGDDADFQVLAWLGAGAPTVFGQTAAQALASGWSLTNSIGSASAGTSTDQTISVNGSNVSSKYWMISAYNPSFGGSQFDAGDDQIKVIGLQATTTVPEPSTYALMAAGLAGVFGFARRRRTNA